MHNNMLALIGAGQTDRAKWASQSTQNVHGPFNFMSGSYPSTAQQGGCTNVSAGTMKPINGLIKARPDYSPTRPISSLSIYLMLSCRVPGRCKTPILLSFRTIHKWCGVRHYFAWMKALVPFSMEMMIDPGACQFFFKKIEQSSSFFLKKKI